MSWDMGQDVAVGRPVVHRSKVTTASFPLRLNESLREHLFRVWTELAWTSQCRKILLTSTKPAAGVSDMTAALALTIADARPNASVILVDMHFRNPCLSRLFDLDKQPGMLDLLAQNIEPNDAIVSIASSHIAILPAGREPGAQVATDPAMFCDQISALSETYDHVLIDAPPVLTTNLTAKISAVADATLLVLQADRTRRRDLVSACDKIEDADGQVTGILLNRYPRRRKWSFPNIRIPKRQRRNR